MGGVDFSDYASINLTGRPPEEEGENQGGEGEEGDIFKMQKDKMSKDDENGETMPPSGRKPQQILKETLTRHLDHQVDEEFASFLEEYLEYDISAPQKHENLPFINRDIRNILNQKNSTEQSDSKMKQK